MLIGNRRRFNMNNNLPDWPFPPGFFDEVEDEEVVNQREVDRENYWDEQRWRREEEKEGMKRRRR
jgi:hypothetical protein